MKTWYDQKIDKVLVLLPIPGESLRAKFCVPYTIDKNFSSVDYIVCTPDGKKHMDASCKHDKTMNKMVTQNLS